jgi:hypothetical protein
LKRCGTTTVPWLMEPKAILFTIKKQHELYYIFRVWILMAFDGFWWVDRF